MNQKPFGPEIAFPEIQPREAAAAVHSAIRKQSAPRRSPWRTMDLGVYPPAPTCHSVNAQPRGLRHLQAEAQVPMARVIPRRESRLGQEPSGVGGCRVRLP